MLEPSPVAQDLPRVVVVDDDDDVREVLELLLEDQGYEVRSARNGLEGMAAFHEVEPHVVILDLMMPVMSGWDMIEALRAGPPHVPVIVLSASHPQPIGPPIVANVPKPVDIDRLLSAVAGALGTAVPRPVSRSSSSSLC